MTGLDNLLAVSSVPTTRESHTVARERVFAPAELASVMADLHASGATGTLMLDLNQGSLAGVRFLEEQRLDLALPVPAEMPLRK